MSACRQLIGIASWRCALAAIVAALSLVHAEPARAAWARVYGLAPTPPASLSSVENHGGDTPLFAREFSIAYGTIEPVIRDEIKKTVDGSKQGTAGCPTAFCSDIHWKVTVNSGFAFTDKGQPVITAFDDPQQIGVDIAVHAQVKLSFDVTVDVWIEPVTGKKSDTLHFPVELVFGIDAAAKLNLWPILQSQGFEFNATHESGSADIVVQVGFASADTAADAEKQIKAQIDKRANLLLAKFKEQVEAEARKAIDAGIQQAVDLKQQLLDTKIPVVEKSFQQLAGAFGLTLDVHTATPWDGVNVVATLRFGAAAGSAKLTGKVRFPKESCTYVGDVVGLLVLAIPTELEKINTGLAAKVGNACASILPASGIKVSRYLGADPKAVVPGVASALPTWQPAGGLSFVGNLVDHKTTGSGAFQSTGYYECGFEISGLSDAAIIELLASSPLVELLGDYGVQPRLRYLEVAVPAPQIVLDANWKLVDTAPQGLVIGGAGQCKPLHIVQVLQVLEELPPSGCPVCGIRKLISECPQCGIRKVRDGLFEIGNPLALLRNPKFKGVVDALKEDEQFQAGPTVQLRLRAPTQTRAPQ